MLDHIKLFSCQISIIYTLFVPLFYFVVAPIRRGNEQHNYKIIKNHKMRYKVLITHNP
jgi:hypothetical protein